MPKMSNCNYEIWICTNKDSSPRGLYKTMLALNLCFVIKKTNQNVTGFSEVFQFLNIVLRSHLIKRTLWGETWSMIEVIKGGLLWCPRATLGDIEQGGVHKLRWPNFATSWPPIISDLPLVDICEWISLMLWQYHYIFRRFKFVTIELGAFHKQHWQLRWRRGQKLVKIADG